LYSVNDYLTPGSDAQFAAIEGIMNHGYEKHGGDIPGASREEFGNAAMSDLNSADTALPTSLSLASRPAVIW